MPYTPYGWIPGDVITAARLNNLEIQYDQAIADQTRQFFVPVFGGTTVTLEGASVAGGVDEAWMKLLILEDFAAITDIEVVFLPLETGASMNFVITTAWGAYDGGELYNVHTETVDPRNIGATTTNQNLDHSISDMVDIVALAVDDLLSVRVLYDAAVIDSNAKVRGLRIKYT